ncbi:MAG: hypothetical protein KKG04_03090, partial [Candidatus Thermoplasmatota archaeon]|nr:hypothetical protein [Candidatus Thermoplasmatota archaeon]
YTGMVVLIAPEVSWDSTFKLLVSRIGYDSSTTEIVVKNVESFAYWYLILLVVVVLVVGGIVFYRSRFRF